jgi:hypothetical protein
MDEQRVQAYVEVIEQLLECVPGSEEELLEANGDLLDEGLLEMMAQYVDLMEREGDSNAKWLRQFMRQVGQSLGLAEYEAEGFLLESVQLILDTESNQAQVYEFWQANVERLNEALLQVMPDVFAMLIQENDPEMIAIAFNNLGNLIQNFPLGSRDLNLEIDLAASELTLQVYTCNAFPEDWAMTQNQ